MQLILMHYEYITIRFCFMPFDKRMFYTDRMANYYLRIPIDDGDYDNLLGSNSQL